MKPSYPEARLRGSYQKTMNSPISEQEAIEKIQQIYDEFLNKIEEIEIARDQKVFSIIRKAEQRQIETIKAKLNG